MSARLATSLAFIEDGFQPEAIAAGGFGFVPGGVDGFTPVGAGLPGFVVSGVEGFSPVGAVVEGVVGGFEVLETTGPPAEGVGAGCEGGCEQPTKTPAIAAPTK